MRALTVCQPWAWAIVRGSKRVENRTWPTHFRGPLLIHAGKSRDWFTQDAIEGIELLEARRVSPTMPGMEYGALIGRCRLVDCIASDVAVRRGYRYVCGPWCFVLADVQALVRPIPFSGSQGFFDVPDNLLTAPPAKAEEPTLFGGGE